MCDVTTVTNSTAATLILLYFSDSTLKKPVQMSTNSGNSEISSSESGDDGDISKFSDIGLDNNEEIGIEPYMHEPVPSDASLPDDSTDSEDGDNREVDLSW